MPSLLIHLAIAKRYVELHPNRITNLNDFCKGSIAPDLNDDFSKMLSKPEKSNSAYITNTIRHILTTTKNGKCKYLDYPKVHSFIEKVSTNLDDNFI